MRKTHFAPFTPVGLCRRSRVHHGGAYCRVYRRHRRPRETVILIPGLGCSAEVWNGTVKHLIAEGFEMPALTLAGLGPVAPIHTSDYLKTVRDDLASYIQQNKLDYPVVIGNSLDGFLALRLAAVFVMP